MPVSDTLCVDWLSEDGKVVETSLELVISGEPLYLVYHFT